MVELTQADLENFLVKTAGTPKLFDNIEALGIYGNKSTLFSNLKSRLEYLVKYSGLTIDKLADSVRAYEQKKPEKKFESINEMLYQDKLHPVIMSAMYGIAEPFMLRSVVKQEMLYLAFKLENIRKIFIAGIGCGEILNSFANVPAKNIEELSIKGVDISKSAIEFLRAKSGSYKFKTEFVESDLDSYKIDGRYDLSEASEVLEHVRNPQEVLTKIRNSSNYVLVTIPIMLDVHEHLHLFNVKDILNLIKNSGLDIIYYSVRNSFMVRQYFFFGLLKKA